MSFDKNKCYVGDFEPHTVFLGAIQGTVNIPLGHEVIFNTVTQEGDLFFSITFKKWRQYSKNSLGVFARHVARKTKIINKIFIDM